MRIFGVDYDTHRVAICGLVNSRAYFWTVEYRGKKEDAFQAVRALRGAVRLNGPYASPDETEVWYVEHAFGANRAVDFKLGRVQGAILSAIPASHAVNEVGPAEWKKALGLKGTAKKDEYVPQLRLKLSLEFDISDVTEHEVDAFGLALYGRLKNRAAVGV